MNMAASFREELVDEHLAKFPPFKGPRTGSSFNVDENVISGVHELRPFIALKINSSADF